MIKKNNKLKISPDQKLNLIIEKIDLAGFDTTFLALIIFISSIIISITFNQELLIQLISKSEIKALFVLFLAYVAIGILFVIGFRTSLLLQANESNYKHVKWSYKLFNYFITSIFYMFLYIIAVSFLNHIFKDLFSYILNIIILVIICVICWICSHKYTEKLFGERYPLHKKINN